jgi:hypothetical protein
VTANKMWGDMERRFVATTFVAGAVGSLRKTLPQAALKQFVNRENDTAPLRGSAGVILCSARIPQWRNAMSALKLFGAAAVLLVVGATPAPAQQVISEPGYCAFFYPYANCQNKGRGNPYTDPNYPRGPGQYAGAWSSSEIVGAVPRRTHRSAMKRRAW